MEQDNTVSLWTKLEQELGLSGRYAISSKIGSGAMGDVFKAHQAGINRTVAIKVIAEDVQGNPEAVARFHREAKVLSTLEHTGILRLFSFGIENNRPYMITDYLEGETLASRLERGPLSLDEFRAIFIQVTDALKYAASRGVIHRDIKPANIFLAESSDLTPRAVLLDFGLVRLVSSANMVGTITATQAVLGSPSYMSPEQCRGSDVTVLSDLYSLGCTMYEAIAGVPVFRSTSVAELLLKQMTEVPPKLKVADAQKREIQSPLADLIMRCLEKEPGERPQSAEELQTLLQSALSATPPDTKFESDILPVATRSSKARSMILGGVFAILLVLIPLVVIKLNSSTTSIVKLPEEALLDDVSKWNSRLETAPDSVAHVNAAQMMTNSLLALGDLYKKEHRLNDAERTYQKALDTANSISSAKWCAKIYKGMSEVYLEREVIEKDPDKKKELFAKALGNCELAVTQAASSDKLTSTQCYMLQTVLLLRARRYKEAGSVVDTAMMKAMQQPQARSPLGSNFAREFARTIQGEIAVTGKAATPEEKMGFCVIFLQVCEMISFAEKLAPDEPALKYAHQWFVESGLSDSKPSKEFSLDSIRKQLNKFDNMAARAGPL